MIREPQVHLFDLIRCLSSAMDLVSPAVVNHHQQVAYIAYSIGLEMGLTVAQRRDLVLSGALHDSGALSLKERMDSLQFELENPHSHAELTYMLLRGFQPLSRAALIARYHHVPWNDGSGVEFRGGEVPLESHVIHLADRVAVLIDREREILGQVEDIRERVRRHKGRMFVPGLVDAFESLASKDFFWFDAVSLSISSVLPALARLETIELDMEGLTGLSNLFSQIIDFRSRFTATHSSGVAASAEAMARLAGFSARECQMMRVAGYLHDLGKLAVPVELLEKPGGLTRHEANIFRSHTFHTYRILERIRDLDVINAWGAFHHERMDGRGYPFHHRGEDLSLGSRIMAVADVFTAITEDRPYRKGMDKARSLEVLGQMAENLALDDSLVSLLSRNFDEINSLRMAAQRESAAEYQKLMQT